MNKPIISIIAAIGKNRELGKDNKLLWQIPEDLKRFKALTLGHAIIMGRKTYESIGRPLPERINIIVSSDNTFSASGCIVAHSLDEALKIAKEKEKNEIYIIGGGQIYKQSMDIADKLYLTLVDGIFDADTYFPEYTKFNKILKEEKRSIEQYTYTFVDLIRG